MRPSVRDAATCGPGRSRRHHLHLGRPGSGLGAGSRFSSPHARRRRRRLDRRRRRRRIIPPERVGAAQHSTQRQEASSQQLALRNKEQEPRSKISSGVAKSKTLRCLLPVRLSITDCPISNCSPAFTLQHSIPSVSPCITLSSLLFPVLLIPLDSANRRPTALLRTSVCPNSACYRLTATTAAAPAVHP